MPAPDVATYADRRLLLASAAQGGWSTQDGADPAASYVMLNRYTRVGYEALCLRFAQDGAFFRATRSSPLVGADAWGPARLTELLAVLTTTPPPAAPEVDPREYGEDL